MRRTTRALTVDPERPDPSAIAEAAQALRDGGLVAFPTETVYGLGADATNPLALARIFEAKGRPSNNPLIIHVDGPEMAKECVAVESLDAGAFEAWGRWWPGPVTFVHPKSPIIPDIATAGSATVGVRMPRSAVALALISALGRPIAAPSANRSTGISPTTAGHVLKDLDGLVDLVLDGGPCAVGLESTVVDMTQGRPRVLRPGPLTSAELVEWAGEARHGPVGNVRKPASPGQARIHYAPRTPSFWVEPDRLASSERTGRGGLLIVGRPGVTVSTSFASIVRLTTPEVAGRKLYQTLHELDDAGLDFLFVVPPPDHPDWEAVRDRLWRATLPV